MEIGNRSHKITLYADDIILTLTDPSNSLDAALTMIAHYGSFSYYKINNAKSQPLPINIPLVKVASLKSSHDLDWQTSELPYLGVKITSPCSLLYNRNYLPLLYTMLSDLNSFSMKALSWVGSVASFQMMTLPKFKYIFRALPIPILQKSTDDFG